MDFSKYLTDDGTKLDLKASEREIDDEGAIALAKLSNLKYLELSYNKVGDEGAKALAKLPKLEYLTLGNNKIGDEGAIALAKLSNLKHLVLHGNKIGDKGAIALAKLSNLKHLVLYGNKIGDKGAIALAKLPNLERLNLYNNKIGDEGAIALAKLPKLEWLYLCSNKIGYEGAIALAKSPFLKNIRISLEGNPISYKGLEALAESENCSELTDNSYNSFYRRLKELWSEARLCSKASVSKLSKDAIKSLFFDLARNGNEEGVKFLLNDPDKYPFLINSRDEAGHTLSHFYTHSPKMQEFLFEHGMIPAQKRNQGRNAVQERRDDLRIIQDSQSVHSSHIVKRINFFTKTLVQSFNASTEQLDQALVCYLNSIKKLQQYDPIKLRLLSLTDNEKRSVMEKTLNNSNPTPNDKEFVKAVFDKAIQTFNLKYLRKSSFDQYDHGYPTQQLQYDYAKDDAKITIPQSLGYIKLLIDKCSIPLKEKKELLVTLMEQNPNLVKKKLSQVKEKLGNSTTLDKEKFDRTELNGLLNGIDDGKKVDELFKEISDLNIAEVWREQKEFVLLKQIYIAATTYGENNSACIQGTWAQIISSINEISSEIVAQYDNYLEQERKQEMQKDAITRENIKPFIEGLANRLVQHVKHHPELKEALEDFVFCIVDIDKGEEITLQQEKILVEINRYFISNIKEILSNYDRNIPSNNEYRLIINGLSEIEVMRSFVTQLNEENNVSLTPQPENSVEELVETYQKEVQIINVGSNRQPNNLENKEAQTPDAKENNTQSSGLEVTRESVQQTYEKTKAQVDVDSDDEWFDIDQNISIIQQQNDRQANSSDNDQSEKRSKLPAVAVAIAALGVAIAVYLEMLAVGIVVGAMCCFVAAAIIYYCSEPSKSLKNSDVQEFSKKQPIMEIKI